MSKFFGSKTTAPPPSNKAKMSEHLLRLSYDQALNENAQQQVVQSYLEMRPKTYAENFFMYFRMAKFLKFISHPLSFILSFPLTFSFFWVYAFGMEKDTILSIADTVYKNADVMMCLVFAAALLVVSAVLFIFEWAQHIALATAYKMYYQTKQIQIPLMAVGIAFSILSIVLSSYGAKEIAEGTNIDPVQAAQIAQLDSSIEDAKRSRKATNTKDIELLKMKDRELSSLRAEKYEIQAASKQDTKANSSKLLGFALVNEGCIHFATFFIFFYMFRSSKEFSFINDLFRGRDYLGLNFLNLGSSTLPDNYNTESTDRINQENLPHRAPTAEKSVNVFDLIENKKTSNDSTQTAAILIEKPKKVKQAQSLVPTKEPAKTVVKTKQKSTGKKFKENELKNYLKIYEKKVQTSKTPKAVQDNKIRVSYIKYALSTFAKKQENGLVFFDVKDAPKWHKENRANLA